MRHRRAQAVRGRIQRSRPPAHVAMSLGRHAPERARAPSSCLGCWVSRARAVCMPFGAPWARVRERAWVATVARECNFSRASLSMLNSLLDGARQ